MSPDRRHECEALQAALALAEAAEEVLPCLPERAAEAHALRLALDRFEESTTPESCCTEKEEHHGI